MTDRELALGIAMAARTEAFATDAINHTEKVLRTFRAEELKEAEENTWNWLIGLSSDNFPMSREKLHYAILGDKEQL